MGAAATKAGGPTWTAAGPAAAGTAGNEGCVVTVVEGERRPLPAPVRWLIVALSMLLASGGILLGSRSLADADGSAASKAPPTVLDARAPAVARSGAAPEAAVRGSARFVPIKPAPVIDTRRGRPLGAGAEATGRLRGLPTGASAVLVEVSLLGATAPGDVSVDAGAGPSTVLRIPRKGVQTTATTVLPVGPVSTLRARTGGGHLLVNLVGAFQPVSRSSAGRIVPVPSVEVLRLRPRTDGKTATIDASGLPVLRRAGPVSALLLQVAADVGPNGGFVEVGPSRGARQNVDWGSTIGTDRTRSGFLVVPVGDGPVRLTNQAGTELRADLVGYVTGDGAPTTDAGLAVPVPPSAGQPVRIPPGRSADVRVIPAAGYADVPADRVAAMLLTVAATGEAVGGLAVHTPGSARPRHPTLVAPLRATRAALTLVTTAGGEVRVASDAGASVVATPRVLVLSAAR